MKKSKCGRCHQEKGRRICKLHDSVLICSTCCAAARGPELCEGCGYYAETTQFAMEKSKKSGYKDFIAGIDPQVDAEVGKALEMVQGGNIREGEKILRGLHAQYAHLHMVQFGMGTLYSMKGQADAAIQYLTNAVEIFPYFIEAWFNLAVAYKQKVDIGKMLKAFQKVVELGDPMEDYVREARNFLHGFEKDARKEFGLSLEAYCHANDIFDDAFASLRNKHYDEAIQKFRQVLTLNPKHTQSYGNLGLCFALQGKRQEALAAFDKALELDPTYQPAIMNRKVVAALKEGQRLPADMIGQVDYYRDLVMNDHAPHLYGKDITE